MIILFQKTKLYEKILYTTQYVAMYVAITT